MKVLILTNHQLGLYKFRKELLEALIGKGYRVYVSVPEDKFTHELRQIGCKVIHNKNLDRRGTNPIQELRLVRYFCRLVEKVSPDLVLTYTIKPNIYGGIACAKMKVPYIANITGLGTSIQNGGVLQALTLTVYKFGLNKAKKIFFQNDGDQSYMLEHGIVNKKRVDAVPGSGVNTDQHCYEAYPKEDTPVIFTTIGRIMKDKGIEEVLGAAERIKERYPQTVFRLIGDFDERYEEKVFRLQEEGVVEYLRFQKDIHPFIASSHAIIHASYHEGLSNVLLEAASTGRPVIATDVHGCIETFEPDVTGIAFQAKSTESLVRAIERFLALDHAEREKMGRKGREKMIREFDRSIVVDKYMGEIERILKRENDV